MTETLQNQYHSYYVSPPGNTLLETLEAISMPRTELAKRMGRPVKIINEIIQAKAVITDEIALQLEQVLRIPASFWLNGEWHYQESLARLADERRLRGWVGWLKEIPVQYMMQQGWIPTHTEKTLQVLEALKFFAVASPDGWRTTWECTVIMYRKSKAFTSNFGALTAWLRQGEIQSQLIDCSHYNEETFHKALVSIRSLTVESSGVWQKELVRLCANAGVAVVFVPEVPKTSMSGAVHWIESTKALIQLGLRYQTEDQFWFTFFHEAGHIVRHGIRIYYWEVDEKNREWEEHEADVFATNSLIDRTQWQQFIAQKSYCTQEDILKFARKVGIAPGIVVARLQQEKLLPLEHCNDLKRRLTWDIEEATFA
jgi:plasmid maintenance system antidote protein VapI/Zn-dependent peptidase ImmA (M78 family)